MRQLHVVAKFKGCVSAYGMPDLHPGKGIPIGASIITQRIVYPELVDYDIGCGMSFIKTGLSLSKLTNKRLSHLSDSLVSIDRPWSHNPQTPRYPSFLSYRFQWGHNIVEPIGMEDLDKSHLAVLGTIGGGNHFAEFQAFDEVYDQTAMNETHFDVDEVHLLVHSGSRSLGESILGRFMEDHKDENTKGTTEDTEEFKRYMQGHELALNFARRNRFLIAHRILG